MKKFLKIMPVLFSLLLLSSCYVPTQKNSVYYNDRVDLLVLYEYTVPFMVERSSEPIGDIEIYPIETDDYGRTLGIMQFNNEADNPLFAENAVYCVLQSGNDKESCFYEDVCCVMVKNGSDPSEAIEQLKQVNDWNQPLALEKCRKLPIKFTVAYGIYKTNFDYADCNKAADEATGWEPRNSWLEVMCKDGNGLWLFTMEQNCYVDNSPVVLIMMKEDASENLSVVETRALENRDSPWEEIHAFKEEMGWQFVNPASN